MPAAPEVGNSDTSAPAAKKRSPFAGDHQDAAIAAGHRTLECLTDAGSDRSADGVGGRVCNRGDRHRPLMLNAYAVVENGCHGPLLLGKNLEPVKSKQSC
jgi:hypothetical protein